MNYDDPSTYHLYFANDDVANGTILTFFNWPNARKGRIGNGQVERIAFRIPKDTRHEWKVHLVTHQIKVEETMLFDRETLEFNDIHGLPLALVETEEDYPSENLQIIGFHGVTLLTGNPEATLNTLVNDMGFNQMKQDENHVHLETVGAWRHHVIVKKVRNEANVQWGWCCTPYCLVSANR